MSKELCTGMAMVGQQCPNKAVWESEKGVKVCEYHKLLLDAFNWEHQVERQWVKLNGQPNV
jgi:hypothetical protein